MNSIGNRVRALREARNLTQESLAARVGVHQSNISHIENGVRGVSFALAVKLAAALDVTVNELASPETPEPA